MIKHRGWHVGDGVETTATRSEEDTKEEHAVGARRGVLFAADEGYHGRPSTGQHDVLRHEIRRSFSTQ